MKTMTNERPPEIRATHLARKAVVYVRQSTAEQVQHNTGSTSAQRGQERLARAWGWSEVDIVDDDLGLSGSAAAHRSGYLRILNEIESGQIGLLMMSDMTRGGRDAAEWLRLIHILALHDVLLVVERRVENLRDAASKMRAQILSIFSEHDTTARFQTMRRGTEATLEKGKAVTKPPTGYVRLPDGSWVKDPYHGVQEAIGAVFRCFRSAPSCKRTLLALRDAGILLPVRHGPLVEWRPPTVQSVYRILTNPAFAGVYRFGRRISDQRLGRDGRGRVRVRLRDPEEIVEIRAHHEPYVSAAEFADIRAVLVLNGASGSRRNLAGGPALCQGVIRCALHGHRLMTAIYKQAKPDGSMPHYYYCAGDYMLGKEQCGRLVGSMVDRQVMQALIERLAPPRVEVVIEALQTALAGDRQESARHRLELQRARLDAQNLESRFLHVDPTSGEVLKLLERRLEEARRRIVQLERAAAPKAPIDDGISEAMLNELRTLCAEVSVLWNAPTTTVQDRKQLIRLMVRDLVFEFRDEERVQLRITWADGGGDSVIGYRLRGYGARLAVEMADDGMPFDEIAGRLNELGVRTTRGTLWTRNSIAQKVRRDMKRRDERAAHGAVERREVRR